MILSKSDIVFFAKAYFEHDADMKEYLQHYLFDMLTKYREETILEYEEYVSMRDIFIAQLNFWQNEEHYGMCGLIKDCAERYEIDIIDCGLDNG